ncbi:MAG: hypothetical protein PHY30_03425 [Candidatus Pacebacteria bacterium]|nr:hypothetical protein [Candidatus Paceibacterota bacterium]
MPKLNIAIKPPLEIANLAIKISENLSKKFSTEFVLDGINCHPHITVYSANYSAQDVGFIKRTEEILENFNDNINFIYAGVSLERGYLGVEFKLTIKIKQLHEVLTRELSLLREEDDIFDYGIKLSKEEKYNVQKYGYPSAGILYHPHLTITRFTESVIKEKLNWNIEKFEATKVGIYIMGKNGTCAELHKDILIKNTP